MKTKNKTKTIIYSTLSVILLMTALPVTTFAQGLAGEIRSLQSVLDELYQDMIPLCSRLIGVGQGLAGFGALGYIGSRVWRSIANAEPIDFYPLLRPFAIGLAIMLFPSLIAVMNGVLKPTVTGTAAMMTNSNNAIFYLLKQKEDALSRSEEGQVYGDEGSFDKWLKYMYTDGAEGSDNLMADGLQFLMSKAQYKMKNAIKSWLSEILQVVYEAAALCINTLRTFHLIVLAILGPIVLGLSVFDGLQNTLVVWFARYINVFLWLPVANIFGAIISKIQENMLRLDIEQIEMYGSTTFSSTDSGYIIFLIIGIVGYFTVPSIANYIVHAGGGSALLARSTNFFGGSSMVVASSVTNAAGAAGSAIKEWYGNRSDRSGQSNSGQGNSGNTNDFQHKKLSGNS